jgi:hypothetical protein
MRHMTQALQRAKTSIKRVTTAFMLLALAGCGGVDGVQFEGKMFEAVGLTGALGKRAEPKAEVRAPLVLPPATEKLPEPGQLAAAPAQPHIAWPDDPDKRRASSEAAKKTAQTEYCRDGNWKEKAMGDEIAARDGPSGTCGSIFSVIGKSLFGD